MAEELEQVETTENPEGETPSNNTSDGQETFDPQRAMDLIEKLRKENRELSKTAKLADKLQAEKAQREQAEMSEMDKLRQELEQAQQTVAQHQRAELQRQAAKEAGLPDDLAGRLTGETLDEMLEDAKGLAAIIPKPKPTVSTTNPPAGQARKPTKEEWDSFLYGGGPLPTRS